MNEVNVPEKEVSVSSWWLYFKSELLQRFSAIPSTLRYIASVTLIGTVFFGAATVAAGGIVVATFAGGLTGISDGSKKLCTKISKRTKCVNRLNDSPCDRVFLFENQLSSTTVERVSTVAVKVIYSPQSTAFGQCKTVYFKCLQNVSRKDPDTPQSWCGSWDTHSSSLEKITPQPVPAQASGAWPHEFAKEHAFQLIISLKSEGL